MSTVDIRPFEDADADGGRAAGHHRAVASLTDAETVATFQATDTKRMDLITDSAEEFYETFEHKPMSGYRIYPGA